jgi:hypothetical protein
VVTVRLQRLLRIEYGTDYSADEPEYPGNFSDPFPAEDNQRRIVDVDWSKPGYVTVTWLTVTQ